MARQDVEVVRRCFEAWDRGDVDGVVAHYAEDVEVDGTRVMDSTYRGREAVREYFRFIFANLRFSNEDLQLIPAEHGVVALTSLRGTGTASGAPVEAPLAYVFTLRGGRVTSVRFYPEPAEALEAAGVAAGS